MSDLEISVKMANRGLILKIKSEMLETYFKHFKLSNEKCQRHKLYNIDLGNYNHTAYDKINNLTHNDLPYHYSEFINLVFIRAEGLSKGVKFTLDQPLTELARSDYLNDLKREILFFYDNTIKPFMAEHGYVIDNYICTKCGSHALDKFKKDRFRFGEQKFCFPCYEKLIKLMEIKI